MRAGGVEVGQIVQVRTQATGQEGARPDLAGLDERGDERVLIEAKFWAGLTENQPVSYLERLPDEQPSALLFVAPTARVESLWAELRRHVSESAAGITLDACREAEELRSAAAGGARGLVLTSWKNLLDRMAAGAAAAADSHTETDSQQLRGLAVRVAPLWLWFTESSLRNAGVEYGAVLDAVVARLEEIAQLISAGG